MIAMLPMADVEVRHFHLFCGLGACDYAGWPHPHFGSCRNWRRLS